MHSLGPGCCSQPDPADAPKYDDGSDFGAGCGESGAFSDCEFYADEDVLGAGDAAARCPRAVSVRTVAHLDNTVPVV